MRFVVLMIMAILLFTWKTEILTNFCLKTEKCWAEQPEIKMLTSKKKKNFLTNFRLENQNVDLNNQKSWFWP